MNVQANFDILFLLNRLESQYEYLHIQEIQNLCYLSLLLSIFELKPLSEWGYSFIYIDKNPTSSELIQEIEDMKEKGKLKTSKDFYVKMDTETKKLYNKSGLIDMKFFSSRKKYLQASVDATLRIPLPLMIKSIKFEPMVNEKIKLSKKNSREILGDGASKYKLYDDFKEIKSVIGKEVSNLWLVSTLWLSYLNALSDKEE